MRGLKFFTRTSDQRCWNVASYHSPHSLTWSWILSFSLPRGDSGRWLGFWTYEDNAGRQWGLQIARCEVQWRGQQPMWYRDLYIRSCDEAERKRYEASSMNYAATRPNVISAPNTLQ